MSQSQKIRTIEDLNGIEYLEFSDAIDKASKSGDKELAKKIMQSLPLSKKATDGYKQRCNESMLNDMRESGFVFYGDDNYGETQWK